MPGLQAYVINLDTCVERLEWCGAQLESAGIPWERVSAVAGRQIEFPIPEYDETKYRRMQGRRRIDAEVGCYLSHIKVFKRFLEGSADYALILEDDAQVDAELRTVVEYALRYSKYWDLLRLSSVSSGRVFKVARLTGRHHLGVPLTRMKGSCAYVVSRKAASAMIRNLLPMKLPYDLAFDLEWLRGYRTLMVTPFPVRQADFGTLIQEKLRSYYLSPWVRYWTVFPCRAFWETGRLLYRTSRLCTVRLRIRLSKPRIRVDPDTEAGTVQP